MQIMIGICIGTFIIEPIIINYIYMNDPGLFNDIILTKKSSEKLRRYYEGQN